MKSAELADVRAHPAQEVAEDVGLLVAVDERALISLEQAQVDMARLPMSFSDGWP